MGSPDLSRLAASIKEAGVRAAFGILGSGRSLELVSELRAQGVAFHGVHFEGSAAMMAGANGLLGGEVGVAISIKGPGLANMIPGLALCKFENLPMIAISEAFEMERPLYRTHKYLNHESLVSAVVKYSDVCDADDNGFEIARSVAKKEVPGPAHMDLISGSKRKSPYSADAQDVGFSGNFSRADLRKILVAAKEPALILGSLCARLKLKDQIEQLTIPVFTTLAAKGVINEELPYAAGIVTGVGIGVSPEKLLLPKADVVLAVGLRLNELLDISEEIGSVTNFDLEVTGAQPRGAIRTIRVSEDDLNVLLEDLKRFEWGESEIYRARQRLMELSTVKSFLPWNVYQTLQSRLPLKTRYVVDTGNFCTVAEHFLVSRKPYENIFSANGRYMGSSLPMGIGASLADPSIPTVVICGDGGIGMYISEIKLAVANELPLLVILMSDRGYASILGNAIKKKLNQEVLEISNPSWSEPLMGFELETSVVERLSDLEIALKNFESKMRPHFIQCYFDTQAYLEMTQLLRP